MLGALVLAGRAQDEAPDDPALSIRWLFGHTLSDLLDGFDDVALFEFSEGPMHMRVMASSVELFGLTANIQRLLVDHVDVEQESQVVVGVGVLVVEKDALLEVLDGVLVVADLEVCQT